MHIPLIRTKFSDGFEMPFLGNTHMVESLFGITGERHTKCSVTKGVMGKALAWLHLAGEDARPLKYDFCCRSWYGSEERLIPQCRLCWVELFHTYIHLYLFGTSFNFKCKFYSKIHMIIFICWLIIICVLYYFWVIYVYNNNSKSTFRFKDQTRYNQQ